MTAELWHGRKPRSPHVQQTLVDLYYHLAPQAEHFVVLTHFRPAANHDIDLLILKRDGIFLAELCRAWDPIVGGRDGEWRATKPDGAQVTLKPGRLNPFKQVQTHYCNWRDWLAAHAQAISADQTRPASYPDIFSYVVFCPDVPPGSRIELGEQPVQIVGLQKFLAALVLRSSARGQLSRQQLEVIPRLLDLEAWPLAASGDDPHRTQKLAPDWQPARVPALIALGHQLSAPMVKLTGVRSLRVGRDDDNDVVIRHPAVSRHHAEIARRGNHWVVRDLGSDNGTFVSLSGETAAEHAVSQSPEAMVNRAIVRFGPAAYVIVL
jgi:hypothetical protein